FPELLSRDNDAVAIMLSLICGLWILREHLLERVYAQQCAGMSHSLVPAEQIFHRRIDPASRKWSAHVYEIGVRKVAISNLISSGSVLQDVGFPGISGIIHAHRLKDVLPQECCA